VGALLREVDAAEQAREMNDRDVIASRPSGSQRSRTRAPITCRSRHPAT
jgi:hypothetical protein